MEYLGWKLLHIASVVIFLGNITTGLFWAARASRTRDFRLIASTFEGIIQSDRWFTMPGVFGVIISGVAAALNGNLPMLSTGWILWPIVMFSISGIVFGVWVAPLQSRIFELASHGDTGVLAWETYEKLYKRWELWGLVAVIASIAAGAIMVLKPALPGL